MLSARTLRCAGLFVNGEWARSNIGDWIGARPGQVKVGRQIRFAKLPAMGLSAYRGQSQKSVSPLDL